MRDLSLITLTTDFGTRDHYVGAVKGVIAQVAPRAQVVDITHEIEPHNLPRAAFVLRQILPWFPRGTIHVVVVDPTVGSDRRILAARYAGQIVLAPDNGIISLVHRDFRVEDLRAVEDKRYFLPNVSATFHGRDIFAPVAAHLAAGLALDRLGPVTDRAMIWQVPKPVLTEDHAVRGEVLYTDRFGNLMTNIARPDLLATYKHRRDVQVYVAGQCVGPMRGGYHEAPPGEPLALIGSAELVEISINHGDAARHFQASVGAPVEIR